MRSLLATLHNIMVRLFPLPAVEESDGKNCLVDIEGPRDSDWGDTRGAEFLGKLDAALGSKIR